MEITKLFNLKKLVVRPNMMDKLLGYLLLASNKGLREIHLPLSMTWGWKFSVRLDSVPKPDVIVKGVKVEHKFDGSWVKVKYKSNPDGKITERRKEEAAYAKEMNCDLSILTGRLIDIKMGKNGVYLLLKVI